MPREPHCSFVGIYLAYLAAILGISSWLNGVIILGQVFYSKGLQNALAIPL